MNLDQDQLETLYTVILAIDDQGKLRHAKGSPLRHVEDLRPGIAFFDHFTFLRPSRVNSVEDMRRPRNSLFLLKDNEDRFAARGQVVEMDWDGERLMTFCGSPWLFWMNSNCPGTRLDLSDFPAQDSQLDQLFLMTTEQRMVADLEKLNADLKIAKRETEVAQEAKSAIFARMSHEMRTPLNGVVSALALMSDESLPEQAGQLLQMARDSSQNLLHVINYVLDVSKIEAQDAAPEPVDFDLRQLMNSVTGILKARAVQKGLDLHWLCSGDLENHYVADKAKLRQCLLNLITNAIKFTPSGHVQLRALPINRADMQGIRFEVEDTGVGISDDDQRKIFEPFWTKSDAAAKEHGTGLGLDILRRNIEAMNGEFGVRSHEGHGSCFWIEIPAEPGDESRAEPIDGVLPGAGVPETLSGHILLVDDNETNLLLGRMILESLGLTVETAENAAGAISMVHGTRFDLILMDISMPGMDGVGATLEIRKFANRDELPILALTAFASSVERERCLRAGMNDYLTKPIVRDRLAEKVYRWLSTEQREQPEQKPSKPAEAPEDQVPCLDESVLTNLLAEVGHANLNTVLDKFESEVKNRRVALLASLEDGDRDSTAREAHTLSSTCRSLGLTEAGGLLSELEHTLRGGGDPAADTPVTVDAALERGLEALRAFRLAL